MQSDMTIMLVDNGSVKPAATLKLRRLAQSLSKRCGHQVQPVSLRHADRIKSDELGGKPALTFEAFLRTQLAAGLHRFIVLPLFFSESAALTSFIPGQVKLLEASFGKFDLQIADVVYPLPDGENQLVMMLFDFIQQFMKPSLPASQSIVLVDHGSPSPKVTAVRQHLAAQLQLKCGDAVIDQAVMERRSGEQYNFNGLLLEQWLNQKAIEGEQNVLVIILFFLPGRHAGLDGDITQICDRIEQQYAQFKVQVSPLIADHDGLIDILQRRLRALLPEQFVQ